MLTWGEPKTKKVDILLTTLFCIIFYYYNIKMKNSNFFDRVDADDEQGVQSYNNPVS